MSNGMLLVTAADAAYFDLVCGCLQSVRDQPAGRGLPIALLDLGCTPEQLGWLAARVDHVARPDWEFDFPGRAQAPAYLRGLLARPFLRRYFPGYEIYFWLDADAWVQDWSAVELFRRGAARKKLAIVPELDRGSWLPFGGLPISGAHNRAWYEAAFGPTVAEQLHSFPTLNAGAFALHHDAPHWGSVGRGFAQGAAARWHGLMTDQVALNWVVYQGLFP